MTEVLKKTHDNFEVYQIKDSKALKPLSEFCFRWSFESKQACVIEEVKNNLDRIFEHGVILGAKQGLNFVGVVTGFCERSWFHGGTIAKENWFYISPEFRNKGVGDILRMAFEEWAKSNGCDKIMISPCESIGCDPDNFKDAFMSRGYDLKGYVLIKEV